MHTQHTAAAKHIKQEGEHFLEFKLNIGFTVPFKYLSDIRPHFLASKWSVTYKYAKKLFSLFCALPLLESGKRHSIPVQLRKVHIGRF